MKVSIRELCEIFKVSHQKLYPVLGRFEFDRFFLGKEQRTRYFDLNIESGKLLRKWLKPRSSKGGCYKVKQRRA